MPQGMIEIMMRLNQSQPKLPKNVLLPEGKVLDAMVQLGIIKMLAELGKYVNISSILPDHLIERYIKYPDIDGVPQGSPTSPFLAILLLDYYTRGDQIHGPLMDYRKCK